MERDSVKKNIQDVSDDDIGTVITNDSIYAIGDDDISNSAITNDDISDYES